MTLPKLENDLPDSLRSNLRDRDSSSRITSRRLARLLEDGLQFGKYRVVRLIAIGGMSEVYEAIHLGLKKRVALKVMRRDLAESLEARQRFIAEGINAARLRHTNVVDVTDVGEVDELPYLVMNLLEGEDLGRVIDRERCIAVPELIDLLLPVASAVALGHDKGVVHRDLKPDNIFLHREGVRVIPKVLDFGVSRVMDARRITLNASVFGTPHYMSPEQARGGPTDARTDQYSLGVILYEAVTGRLPRDSANPLELLHAVAYDSFRPPSVYVELPPELEAAILRAMAHDPDDRFPTMRDMALALVPFASESARDYWSVELGQRADRISETRVPEAVRHPSPSPEVLIRRPSSEPPVRCAPPELHALEFELPPGPAGLESSESPSLPAPQTLELVRRPSSRSPLPDSELVAPDPLDRTGPIPKRRTPTAEPTRATSLTPPTPRILAVQILPTSDPPPPRDIDEQPVVRRRSHATGFVATLVLAIAIAGVIWTKRNAELVAAPVAAAKTIEYFQVDVRSDPSNAVLRLDGAVVGEGHFSGRLPRDGATHELRATAEGWNGASVRFRDLAPPAELKLERAPQAEEVAPKPTTVATAPATLTQAMSPMAAAPARPIQRNPSPAFAPLSRPTKLPAPPNPPDTHALQESSSHAIETPAAVVRTLAEPQRPRVRLVDDHEPNIQVVE